MAAGSLLLLLDDIASALDDVALMTKVAASKAAAVVGDDLALNAQQLTGIAADRELRVVWAVAVGSLRNKLVLVPAAIALSAFTPQLVIPLLVLGGAYLCYEGAEKITHRWLHPATPDTPTESSRPSERERIRGAIRTDFILSAEIIIIALGTITDVPLTIRISVLVAVGLLMTVGVYGLVAGIVKIDDLGLYLSRVGPQVAAASMLRAAGRALVLCAPWLMRFLSIAGTVAMFLVGGGILQHGIATLHALPSIIANALVSTGVPLSLLTPLAATLTDAGLGLCTGLAVLTAVTAAQQLRV